MKEGGEAARGGQAGKGEGAGGWLCLRGCEKKIKWGARAKKYGVGTKREKKGRIHGINTGTERRELTPRPWRRQPHPATTSLPTGKHRKQHARAQRHARSALWGPRGVSPSSSNGSAQIAEGCVMHVSRGLRPRGETMQVARGVWEKKTWWGGLGGAASKKWRAFSSPPCFFYLELRHATPHSMFDSHFLGSICVMRQA